MSDPTASEGTDDAAFGLALLGYGVSVIPTLPCSFATVNEGPVLFGPHPEGDLIGNVMLVPGKPPTGAFGCHALPNTPTVRFGAAEPKTTALLLGANMQSYSPVLQAFERGPDGPWRIHCRDNRFDYHFEWPTHASVRVMGEHGSGWPFELQLGPTRDEMLSLRGPTFRPHVPTPSTVMGDHTPEAIGALEGEGSTIEWVEIRYNHADTEWRQRMYFVPAAETAIYVATVQATMTEADAVFIAAERVATSFEATPR